MPLDERTQAELLATFQAELQEHGRALSRAFLALEKEPEPVERGRLLDAAFRSAHNLKGAARAVALGALEALAHRLEGVLGAVKRDELDLSPALFDLLYAAVDSLGDAFSEHESGATPDARLNAVAEQLEAVRAGHLQPTAASDALRAPEGVRPAELGLGETIRLPTARLDMLLEQLGELVIPRVEVENGLAELAALRGEVEAWQREWRSVRPQLRQLEREAGLSSLRPLVRFLERNESSLASLAPRLNALQARLAGPAAQLGGLTDDLQADMKRFRMLPFGHVSDGLERVVRDLARSLGKEARLVLVGSDTELDRRALEEMKDPLLHLVRNALDHGIESPAERQRLGKPSIGSLVITASQRGSSVVIEVEDDGAGIAAETIRQAAAERGLAPASELAAMHDGQVLRLILLPGFSTRAEVSELSGRGVGLDVVARHVERLGGRLDLESWPSRGTRFTVTLPLMLATTRALLVEAGDALYALPMVAVERVLRPACLGSVGGQSVLEQDGIPIPVEPLARLLGTSATHTPPDPAAPPCVALLGIGARRIGVIIDRVVGEQEIVLKPLPYPLLRARYVAGASILGSGRVVPVLNVADLVGTTPAIGPALPPPQQVEPQSRRLRVLVADDSLTTRSLERYILEAAGYEVDLAGDGLEALGRLQERSFDVLVSDIDMPGLDGIELTAKVRALPNLRDLPVILVTSLDSAEDRERGLQAGADAYIVKSSFDQDHLLRTIRELV